MEQLVRADGESYLLAYRPHAWLRSVDGRTVRVTGAIYRPRGQAILATHYRVDTLWVVGDESEVPILGFGPQTALKGKFVQETVPKGRKNEGDLYWTFVTADGAQYLTEDAPEGIADGVEVEVEARAVEPSMSHAARRGGDWLYVLDREETHDWRANRQ